jgi:hypothetical protein
MAALDTAFLPLSHAFGAKHGARGQRRRGDFSASSGIIVDGEDCREIVERYLRMGSARAFAPLREGGAARRKMACGLRVWSGRKGRRGKYCGWLSMQAFAWSIRRGMFFLLALESRDCRDGRPQYSPPSRPLPLVFCHASAFHSWPRPPLSEGGGACRPSCSLHSWNSRGGSTIIPEGPFFWEGLRTSKTALPSVCPAFSGCEVSSNKRSIQNLSVSPSSARSVFCTAGIGKRSSGAATPWAGGACLASIHPPHPSAEGVPSERTGRDTRTFIR